MQHRFETAADIPAIAVPAPSANESAYCEADLWLDGSQQ
jgi:hypothetical protein